MEPEQTPDAEQGDKFESLKKVTPLSKYLAMALFVILPFLGGYVGYMYAPEKVVEVERVVEVVNKKMTVTTPSEWYDSVKRDLVDNTDEVAFRGLYRVNDKTAWEATNTCNQLYVRGYPQNVLHEYYVHKILSGNTVQRFGEYGLLLNLPWDEIPIDDQETIKAATDRPITVLLKKNNGLGGGVGPCHSFFTYVGLGDGPEVVDEDGSFRNDTANNNIEERIRYGAFMDVKPSAYHITRQDLELILQEDQVVPDNIYAKSARKISERYSLVKITSEHDTHFPYAIILYDEESNEIVRKVKYVMGTMEEWLGPYVRVVLEWNNDNTNQRIVLYDYLNDVSEVLYTEDNQEVQLADVCELGCAGILYATTDNTIVFARHEKIKGTTATKFIETVSIQVPERYSSESQWESI